jgi:S1-C subfamily serine protease
MARDLLLLVGDPTVAFMEPVYAPPEEATIKRVEVREPPKKPVQEKPPQRRVAPPAKPKKSLGDRFKNPWVTCGVVVLGLACLGVVFAFGGFTTILTYIGLIDDMVTPTPLISLSTPEPPTPGAISAEVPYKSAVQIIALYYDGDELVPGWSGSGSILTPDGYILTNAHVVLSDRYYQVEDLVVALTTEEDQPPEPMYYAEVIQADAELNLPYIPLGDSDELRLGDPLTIIGYPTIGGGTITLTRGDVSGFTAQTEYGDRAFIKTSATIAGGNSGGLAATDDGHLVGIPTQLGYGGDDQYVDCRVLADTNRDGIIDENDNCVPTGGFINALRPVKLAIPLIDAARRGEVNIVGATVPQEVDGESGWADYVNGAYHINVIPDNYFIWANPGLWFSDVVIGVDIGPVVTTGAGDFGILCRYQDEGNFYGLEITEDGYFSIWKYENSEYTNLSEWEYSDWIPIDGSVVALSAACLGNTLALAVDGYVILEIQDSSFTEGDIGLIAGTWDEGGLTMGYDNLVVLSPGD